MPKTSAEKVRAFRERQKQKKAAEIRRPQARSLTDVFATPFFEHFQNNGNATDFDQAFDMMGLDAPAFTDDAGPKSNLGQFEADPAIKETTYPDSARSLEKAELMIGCLLDAAVTLAGIVRTYKRTEIDTRVEEISASTLADPATQKAALARIVALTKMREQLDKEVRWMVPQWRVESL